VPIDDAEQLLCFIALGDVEEPCRRVHADDRCSALRQVPGDNALATGQITDAQTLDVADQIEQGWEHEIVDKGTCVDAVVIPLGDLIIRANGHGYSHYHICSPARSSSDKRPVYSF
jgi:hypothetical protein